MLFNKILALTYIAFSFNFPSIVECEIISIDQIIKSRNFPAQVFLINTLSKPFCSGALLTRDLIITTAQCVRSETKFFVVGCDREIVKGLFDNLEHRKLNRVCIHPFFQEDVLAYDVAVLKVEPPFQLTSQCHAIPLAGENSPDGTKCYIASFGIYKSNEEIQGSLHYNYTKIAPKIKCHHFNPNFDKNSMICAGIPDKTSCCLGIPGSFLICNGRTEALLSFGCTDCNTSSYALYSSIPIVFSWITDYVLTEKCDGMALQYKEASGVVANYCERFLLILITLLALFYFIFLK